MKRQTQYTVERVACGVWRVGCCLPRSAFRISYFVLGLALLWGCTSVRPVVKIGVLAPFEGLYRRTGYDVLAAVRAAIGEVGPGSVDLLPLALDDSNDPARAVRATQKLLLDPDLQAIIGPLTLEPLLQVTSVLHQRSMHWFSPLAIDKTGFLSPANQKQALTELSARLAETVKQQGAQRLVLAGASHVDTWPWPNSLALPVVVRSEPSEISAGDAIFWLGDAATAADFLNRLRPIQPEVPFWLGAQAEDPVFRERTAIRTHVYWAAWVDPEYDQWSQTHPSVPVYAYQTYAAAKQAIGEISGGGGAKQVVWQLRLFTLSPEGQSRPLAQK